MDAHSVWIGIDLGLTQAHLCAVDSTGEMLHETECESSFGALTTALSAFPLQQIEAISVEAGNDTHIVRKLRSAGYPVKRFEARKASKFLEVRFNKSDRSDAKGIADLGRLGLNTVSEVHLKSPECERLRSQLVIRSKIISLCVKAENALRSRLAFYGLKYRSTDAAGGVRKQVLTQLENLLEQDGIDLFDELSPLVEICELLKAYINKLNRAAIEQAHSNAVCRRLMEVPGVGPICALSFYTAIDDPTRFKRACDVGPYLGLNPRRYQSGEVARTRKTKRIGSRLTRTHLYIAAGVFGTVAPDCALKQWYKAMRERSGSRRARIALARKLAIIMLTIWKRGSRFEPFPVPLNAPVGQELGVGRS